MLDKPQPQAASSAHRIAGDAMRRAGLFDGDEVLADSFASPKAGDVVIVRLACGRVEARRVAGSGGALALGTDGPCGFEADMAADADWTVLGVARRLTRDL